VFADRQQDYSLLPTLPTQRDRDTYLEPEREPEKKATNKQTNKQTRKFTKTNSSPSFSDLGKKKRKKKKGQITRTKA
jgi:hypothetical protein